MTIVAIPGAPRHQLATNAAARLAAAIAAGCPVSITSAWRSAAEQTHLRTLYVAGRGNFALPASQSLHVTGLAIDTGNKAGTGPMQQWLVAHGETYGIHQTAPAVEPWHFEIDDTPLEDDMATAAEIWGASFGKGDRRRTAGQMLAEARTAALAADAKVSALTAVVEQLAAGQGVDPAQVRQAVRDALDETQITLTIDTED